MIIGLVIGLVVACLVFIIMSNERQYYDATFVTCFYEFKSKHSVDEYRKWMKDTLVAIRSPIIVFTESKWEPYILECRKGLPTHVIIRPLSMLHSYATFQRHGEQQRQLDPERDIHNLNLYVVWNEKMKFMQEAYSMDLYQTQWYVWCDIGYFRSPESNMRSWPTSSKLCLLPKDKITMAEPYKPTSVIHVAAGMFLMHRSHLNLLCDRYYAKMSEMISNGEFAGVDQCVFKGMYPESLHLIRSVTDDPWFELKYHI